MATSSINLTRPKHTVDASKFSQKAQDWGWHTATQNLVDALLKMTAYTKAISNLLRYNTNNTAYDTLYGADEIVPELAVKRGFTSYNRDYARGFVVACVNLGTKFYNVATPTAVPATGVRVPTYDNFYSVKNTIASARNVGLELPYFDAVRLISVDTAEGTVVEVNDPTSYFHGCKITYDLGYSTSEKDRTTGTRYGQINRLLTVLINYRASLVMLREIVNQVPAVRRGYDGKMPAVYTAGQVAYWAGRLGMLLPHEVVQLRQALTKIRNGTKYATYMEWVKNHHIATGLDATHEGYMPSEMSGDCTTCATMYDAVGYDTIGELVEGELGSAGFKLMTDYAGTPATEIPDQTRDITVYTNNATIESDPLLIANAGLVPMYDDAGNLKLTIGVCLIRKYCARRAMVAWDYKEATNPNAFEAYGGKANYRLSNMRSWLNSEKKGLSGWKIKQHEYDDFWSGGQEGYMCAISEVLRSNIAKTVITYNEQTTAAQITGKVSNIVFSEDWAFIPELYDYNSSAKGWTNFNLGGYAGIPSEQITALAGWANTSDVVNENLYLGDKYYNDGSTKRYYMRLGKNPNFKGDTATYDSGIYLPTRTMMNAAADTRDATIANRVGCYCIKTPHDGTGKTSTGANTPTNYEPAHYCMALVPFHAEELDGVPKAKCNGPTLSY